MWFKMGIYMYNIPFEKDLNVFYKNNIPKFKSIIYFSLDLGIIWSPKGYEYPIKDWVWCSQYNNFIVDYIQILYNNNILPVFYGNKIKYEIVLQVYDCFVNKLAPLIFLGMPLEILNLELLHKTNKYTSIEYIKFENTIENGIYRLGPWSSVGINLDYEHIGINQDRIIDKINKQTILILMGQSLSGKTYLANKMSKKGWCHIKSSIVAQIQNSFTRNSKIIQDLIILIKSLKQEKSFYKGIVIDAENAKYSERKIFEDLAKEYDVDYIVGIITKPGYIYNEPSKKLNIILENYSKNLELPENENNVRLI